MRLLAEVDINDVVGKVQPPKEVLPFVQAGGGNGAGGLSLFLTNLVGLIFALGGVAFLFMILFGAFQWIISGGDKESISKARSRITNAIIGLVLLALSFVIVNVIGQVLGFQIVHIPGRPYQPPCDVTPLQPC